MYDIANGFTGLRSKHPTRCAAILCSLSTHLSFYSCKDVFLVIFAHRIHVLRTFTYIYCTYIYHKKKQLNVGKYIYTLSYGVRSSLLMGTVPLQVASVKSECFPQHFSMSKTQTTKWIQMKKWTKTTNMRRDYSTLIIKKNTFALHLKNTIAIFDATIGCSILSGLDVVNSNF